MKKFLIITLSVLLLLSLCACGSDTGEDTTPKDTTLQGEETVESTTPDTTAVPETTEDILELVRSYIDKPIEELYAVIGEPESSDYAPSCLMEGEDGMLFYDGFIVYTYRLDDTETVIDVE